HKARLLHQVHVDVEEQGKKFKEATGKYYIGSEDQSSEGMMVRLFDTLLWQQGVDVLSADGKTASINTAEGLNAAKLISSIFSEGLANPALDYPGSEQAFLNGETGILNRCSTCRSLP
ncbi:hypothetical protein AB9E28_34320, partial [Rhizobium leguminosarum]